MEIWSCKSSAHDESKISKHVSHVSHVSRALSRLAFLRDTCIMRCVACVASSVRDKCENTKSYIYMSHMSHVSPALRRLTFLRDMCLKPHAAHVPHVPRDRRVKHIFCNDPPKVYKQSQTYSVTNPRGGSSRGNRSSPLKGAEAPLSHMSQPLPRLAFLRDTCIRQRVACVAHAEHMRRVQSKITNTCLTCLTCHKP